MTHLVRCIALAGLLPLAALLCASHSRAEEVRPVSPAGPAFRAASDPARPLTLALPSFLDTLEAPRLVVRRSRNDFPIWVDRVREGEGLFGGGVRMATRPIRLAREERLEAMTRTERARVCLVGASLMALRLLADDEVEVRFRIPLP